MSEYEEKLKKIIKKEQIDAEHLIFDKSCHSVAEAAETVGAEPEDFIKSIVMIDDDKNVVVGIVKGEDRVSTKRVAKFLSLENLKIALPEEILELTGFPLGGTPGFGFDAVFLVDPKVMKKEKVYLGGGSGCALTHMSTKELVSANGARIVRIRK